MHVDEALSQRFSVRAFLPDQVNLDTLTAILEMASRAPSGGNLQPWRVIAVSGAAKQAVSAAALAALQANPAGEAGEYPIYPEALWEPYRSRRYQVGEDMYALLGIAREDKFGRMGAMSRNFAFFGAPVGLFFIMDRRMGHGQWAHMGMLMQSIALAAQARGLSTCMQEAWAMVRQTIGKQLELGEHEVLYCGMAIGKADPQARVNALRTAREPVSGFVRFLGFEG